MTGATTSFAGLPVELAALVTPANSTAQIFAGTTYYGHDYTQDYGPQQVVPFYLGPQGIVNAIDQNSGGTQRNIAVVASGWGAGQTGTALATMQQSLDPALQNVHLAARQKSNPPTRPAATNRSSSAQRSRHPPAPQLMSGRSRAR
jgi:hypothetical protein